MDYLALGAVLVQPVLIKTLLAIVSVVLSSWAGHYIVTFQLKQIGFGKYCRPPLAISSSKWIGIFERGIISMLVLGGAVSATVFVFAAKAALMPLRLKAEANGKEFTEYVLIGTLLSYFVALLFGFFGRVLWRIFL